MYAVLKGVNGNFAVHAEGITTESNAKYNYHNLCATLWNAPDVETATVMLVDDKLRMVDGYCEQISHPQSEE